MALLLDNDAPRRLAILDHGLFEVHENGRVIGIVAFFVETGGGKRILIDGGFPPKYVEEPERAVSEDGLAEFGRLVRIGPENTAAGQLALMGLTLEDIDLHILTHSHVDHVGALNHVPNATLVMSEHEASLDEPIYWAGRSPIRWPQNEIVTISGDTSLCGGLDLLATPGHTEGHLSIVVDLPKTGTVILTGDAISRPAELDEGYGGAWDQDKAEASARRLMDLAQERDAMIIYGHCPEQWPTLPKAPQWLD